MRKTLLGTSALIAVGLLVGSVNVASAADPIKLGISGEINQWVGGGNSDNQTRADGSGNITNYATFTAFSDNGLKFSGSTKLDNGINVTAILSYDADTAGRNDNYVKFTSDKLGDLRLGILRGPEDTLAHSAPGVGIGNSGGDYGQFVVDTCTNCDGRTSGNLAHTRGNGVVYYTPRFAGAGIGVSFQVNQNTSEPGTFDLNNTNGNGHKAEAAFVYEHDIAGVGVGFNVGYTNDNGDSTHVSSGLNLSMNGFTVGGSWGKLVVDDMGADTYAAQGRMWDVGASYETGPYSVSLNYSDTNDRGAADSTSSKNTRKVVIGSVAYDIGAGVALKGSVFHIKTKDEANVANNENSAVGAALGVSVGF